MKFLRRFLLLLFFGAAFVGIAWQASFLPNADWNGTYYPVIQCVLKGKNPYLVPGFHNPPWTVLFLLPFGMLSPEFARGLFFSCGLLVFGIIVWKTKAPPAAALAVLLSPTMIGGLLANNLDIFVLAGILLPPAWGLFVLLVKPQLGFGAALYYLIDSWQTTGWRQVVRIFFPITLAFLFTVLLFPEFVSKLLVKPAVDPWNRSIFPYGIPIGLLFLWLSIRYRNAFFALAVAPLLSPYTTLYSYVAIQIALLHVDVERWIRRDVLHWLLTLFLWTITLAFGL